MADAPTINGLRVVSLRLLHPWRGAWQIDADIDTDTIAQAPTSGPATIVAGGSTLVGTVDARGSGTFVSRARARVVAGAGGWDTLVPPIHVHADNTVTDASVYASAASIVGETTVVPTPAPLSIDFVRSAGPASRVLDDVDWYLDLAGVTQVGSRPISVADPSLTLIDWDPIAQRAELTCDALVLPGTVLSDPRLNGFTPTIRDVEQTFDAQGSRIVAWCAAAPVSRLMAAMANMIRELGGLAYLKTYQYRIVLENSDGRLQLQAVDPSQGMPDMLPLRIWPGMSGDSAQLKPSSEVLVHFVNGNPLAPAVLGFSSQAIPLKRTIDASLEVEVGPSAALVALAGGVTPLATAPWGAALVASLAAFATALGGVATGPLAPLAAPASALGTALGLLPPGATTKTVAQ